MLPGIIGVVLLLFAGVGVYSGAPLWLIGGHFLIGVGLLLYAGVTSLGDLRSAFGRDATRRGLRFGGNALTQMLALSLILGLIAYLSVRNPVRWDLTEGSVHTLTQATLDLLSQVPEAQPIEVYAFFGPGSEADARRIFDRYEHASERFVVVYHDPYRRPALAESFDVDRNGVIIVCAGPCESTVASARVAEASEQELTRAIRSVISTRRKVYFSTGHGEAALDDDGARGFSRVSLFLKDENIEVAPILLAELPDVPDDADAVVIGGPDHSFLDRELDTLDRYLRAGGSVFVLSEPIVVSKLEALVEGWGIELGDNVIVDQTIDLFAGPKLGVQAVVTSYGFHPATEKMQGLATMFRLARSVRPVSGGSADVVELAKSGARGWAESDVEQFSKPRPMVELNPEVDIVGPVSLAVARTFEVVADSGDEAGETPREGRLIVVGDSDFARNGMVSSAANADLFINMVTWLIGEEAFITVDRKLPRASSAQMTTAQVATFRYLSLFALPELILFWAIVNWWRRRE